MSVATAPAPSAQERYCAWFGDSDGEVLYFGQAAFWSTMRAADGDPLADMHMPGPQLIGRFDLATETLLPPLSVGTPGSRSGVWDVWHLSGTETDQVYFTTFFEEAGSVDPETGRIRRLYLGGGLNELADGPGGSVLATRYGSGDASRGDGGVIAIAPEGGIASHWPVTPPPGYRVAPKTPLWDPARSELWVTTDLLPLEAGSGLPERHDTYVLPGDGGPPRSFESPEVQFVARGDDGTLYAAEVSGSDLQLRIVAPPGNDAPRLVPLDPAFPADFDFVQDIQPAPDGRVAVTRWSGRVHVLQADGSVRTAQLPRLDPDGLYYTGVLHGDRLCVTYCADVTVVCVDAP